MSGKFKPVPTLFFYKLKILLPFGDGTQWSTKENTGCESLVQENNVLFLERPEEYSDRKLCGYEGKTVKIQLLPSFPIEIINPRIG